MAERVHVESIQRVGEFGSQLKRFGFHIVELLKVIEADYRRWMEQFLSACMHQRNLLERLRWEYEHADEDKRRRLEYLIEQESLRLREMEQWRARVEAQYQQYHRQALRIEAQIDSLIPQGIARLNEISAKLEAFLAIQPPGGQATGEVQGSHGRVTAPLGDRVGAGIDLITAPIRLKNVFVGSLILGGGVGAIKTALNNWSDWQEGRRGAFGGKVFYGVLRGLAAEYVGAGMGEVAAFVGIFVLSAGVPLAGLIFVLSGGVLGGTMIGAKAGLLLSGKKGETRGALIGALLGTAIVLVPVIGYSAGIGLEYYVAKLFASDKFEKKSTTSG